MNKAADITDLYIFPGETADTTAIVVAFSGFTAADMSGPTGATYDENVLYHLHIDNDMDNSPNISIAWRYGQNSAGDWGIQVKNAPGTTEDVVGAVDTALTSGNATIWTGAADDPFFFDAVGYLTTLGTGDLAFDNSRDFLAGLNVTSFVIEVPTADLGGTCTAGGGNCMQIWATTGVYSN